MNKSPVIVIGGIVIPLFVTIAFFAPDATNIKMDSHALKALKETLTKFLLTNTEAEDLYNFGIEYLVGMRILGTIAFTFAGFILLRSFILRIYKRCMGQD